MHNERRSVDTIRAVKEGKLEEVSLLEIRIVKSVSFHAVTRTRKRDFTVQIRTASIEFDSKGDVELVCKVSKERERFLQLLFLRSSDRDKHSFLLRFGSDNLFDPF